MIKNVLTLVMIFALCIPGYAKEIEDQPIRGQDYLIQYQNQKNLDTRSISVVYAFDYWGTKQAAFHGPKGLFKNVTSPDSGRASKVEMVKKMSVWEATILIPDSVTLLSYYFTDEINFDYNNKKTYISYIYNTKGKPVENARFRNIDFLVMADASKKDILSEIEAEIEDYPKNWIAHTVYWRKTFENAWFFRLDAALDRANNEYDQLVQRLGASDSLKHVKANYLLDYLRHKRFAGPDTYEKILSEFTALMETIPLENQYGGPKRQYESHLRYQKMEAMMADLVGTNIYADSLNVDFNTIEGEQGKLSDFQGNYLLLDFWGTWCGPCVGEIPNMKKAYESYHENGFEILSICGDRLDEDGLREYVSEKEMNWTHVLEELGSGPIQKRFNIMSYPSLFLIDPEGILVAMSGDLRGDQLIKKLEEVYGD